MRVRVLASVHVHRCSRGGVRRSSDANGRDSTEHMAEANDATNTMDGGGTVQGGQGQAGRRAGPEQGAAPMFRRP